MPFLKLADTFALTDEQIGSLTMAQLAGMTEALSKAKGAGGDKETVRRKRINSQEDFADLANKFKE